MTQQVFEEYADDYDRWFNEHHDEYLAELSRIRQVLPPHNSRCIEVGVGSGRFAAPLGFRLGIEPSQALCQMAYQRGIEVIRGIVEALPIRDGSYSFVLFITVICFLDDPKVAFREIHRILSQGGYLLTAFIEREGMIHQKYIQKGGKGRFLSHARYYSEEEVRKFLEDNGLGVIKVDSRAGFCIIISQKTIKEYTRPTGESLK